MNQRRHKSEQKEGWSNINSLTHKAADRHIFNRRLTAAAVCQTAAQVGEKLFDVISFHNGCLKVAVTSYDAVTEVMIQQTTLIKHINQKLGANKVVTLRISVNPVAKESNYE